jgi:hypothetical protein
MFWPANSEDAKFIACVPPIFNDSGGKGEGEGK